ncbi:hypothetical protein P879_09598 [Paragonimus westermani]|uniref:Uncharacterized protein n=1 Tax=Paragonimus westermani TaxID=34504 RepID=A0A8T0D8V5_9TREM|nr:hypothetical protein P879_09598 [Paragonimus westermani]
MVMNPLFACFICICQFVLHYCILSRHVILIVWPSKHST